MDKQQLTQCKYKDSCINCTGCNLTQQEATKCGYFNNLILAELENESGLFGTEKQDLFNYNENN